MHPGKEQARAGVVGIAGSVWPFFWGGGGGYLSYIRRKETCHEEVLMLVDHERCGASKPYVSVRFPLVQPREAKNTSPYHLAACDFLIRAGRRPEGQDGQRGALQPRGELARRPRGRGGGDQRKKESAHMLSHDHIVTYVIYAKAKVLELAAPQNVLVAALSACWPVHVVDCNSLKGKQRERRERHRDRHIHIYTVSSRTCPCASSRTGLWERMRDLLKFSMHTNRLADPPDLLLCLVDGTAETTMCVVMLDVIPCAFLVLLWVLYASCMRLARHNMFYSQRERVRCFFSPGNQ